MQCVCYTEKNENLPFIRKVFLTYLFIQLLKQQVDALELATSEDKLVAIADLCFSISLSQLENI
jgi:hypothetical protein